MNLSPEKRELAREAKELKESPAFATALERAKQRRINELMSEATTATERKLELIAELRAFQAVEQELKSIADDLIMGRRYA